MKCYLKTLMPAALLTLGLGIGHGFAGEHQAGAVAWSLGDSDAGVNGAACMAENDSDPAIAAAIHMAPSRMDLRGDATPWKALIVATPDELSGAGAGRQCAPLTLVTRTH
jgi:hypothetical protein